MFWGNIGMYHSNTLNGHGQLKAFRMKEDTLRVNTLLTDGMAKQVARASAAIQFDIILS